MIWKYLYDELRSGVAGIQRFPSQRHRLMMKEFEIDIDVQWRDCDPNMHVRHSAYYDYGAHIRIRYFQEIGFGVDEMKALKMGPILFKEECSFIREIKPEARIRINILKGEIKSDASRWTLHHEIFDSNNAKAAHISVNGAWMDLAERRLTKPPSELAAKMRDLPSGEQFTYKKS